MCAVEHDVAECPHKNDMFSIQITDVLSGAHAFSLNVTRVWERFMEEEVAAVKRVVTDHSADQTEAEESTGAADSI